LINLEEMDL